MNGQTAREPITLPESFPQSDYTPFGYIDNPYHCAVLNRSGTIRSVPPLGFGFWCRQLPWPYGEGNQRRINYLSLLHLSLHIDGVTLHTSEDFEENGVEIVSRYHTKTMMSYDWEFQNLRFSAKYFLAGEHTLACILESENLSEEERRATLFATNIYGFPETPWWGVVGVTGRYAKTIDAVVSKLWPYGDVFVLGSDRPSDGHAFTDSEEEWARWVSVVDGVNNENGVVNFKFPDTSVPLFDQTGYANRSPGQLYSAQRYSMTIPAHEKETILVLLCRGVNETETVTTYENSLQGAVDTLREQLKADEAFYRRAPVLTGDWPPAWKHGWIYDLETIRMNIRPPVGIYNTHWDAMQVHTPRQVLGETALDTMCLSYADIELAKEVLFGTFADSPAPNVPCSREDGSMNMISATGSECGTAPIWGLPFHVIHSIYLRDRDNEWIRSLYPYLKAFLEWWLENRTDEEGWFHADCSWESGQDASKRFLVKSDTGGDFAGNVRTVDIEAAVAEAMKAMILFAEVAGEESDIEYWGALAETRIERARSMYVDGWFRDFDAGTGEPIILDDYYDVMMLVPLATGIATREQFEGVRPMFRHFKDNPRFWLEWPSFMFPFCEAGWNAGERLLIGEIVARTAERIYPRLDQRKLKPVGRINTGIPDPYNYRLPGVSDEFWPLEVSEDNPGGCENYGWGATLPTLVIRNIIGFREVDDVHTDRFVLAPAFPVDMARRGQTYGISNLAFRGSRAQVRYEFTGDEDIQVHLEIDHDLPREVEVSDADGHGIRKAARAESTSLSWFGQNGALYRIAVV